MGQAPLEMSPEEFRHLGHRLVDRIASFLAGIRTDPLTPGETPAQLRPLIRRPSLPQDEASAEQLVDEAADLLLDHSLRNGHPRFLGYITSTPAPIGALATCSPRRSIPTSGLGAVAVATEIEAQTIRWIAELMGYPSDCGGLLVSGGNMANFVCFLAGRRRRRAWACEDGVAAAGAPRVYARPNPHVGPEGRRSLRAGHRRHSMDRRRTRTSGWTRRLRERIAADRAPGISRSWWWALRGRSAPAQWIRCRRSPPSAASRIWFHVDGAYGAPGRGLPDAPEDLHALALADSLAVDPHKWLYAPLEAGCVLVRDAGAFAQRVLLTAALLPLRDGGMARSTSRLRPAEFARLPRAQGLAGAPARAGRAATSAPSPTTAGWRRAVPGGGRAP